MRTVEISFKPYFICEYSFDGSIINYQRKYLTVFDYQGYILNRDRRADGTRTPLDVMYEVFRPFRIRNFLVNYDTVPYITFDVEIIIDETFTERVLNIGNGREEDKIRNYFIEKYSEYIQDNYGTVTLSENVKNNLENITRLLFSWIDEAGDGDYITKIYIGNTFYGIREFHHYD